MIYLISLQFCIESNEGISEKKNVTPAFRYGETPPDGVGGDAEMGTAGLSGNSPNIMVWPEILAPCAALLSFTPFRQP